MRQRQDGVAEHQTQSGRTGGRGPSQDAQDVGVRVGMASGRMAPSNAKSGRNVRSTLRPDSRFAFRRQVRQTHGMHGTQGIFFADDHGT